ncbi:hypothetical protein JYQ78_16700 [Anaerobutyricum hallii]|uniref:hypothetical protein n=1 Tax=Anaerobutyricum hallii TaxID=39488 RepID=UPI001ADD7F77|nr:hypothetical protein [Anaerobutyricum hallii]MBP0064818.1 hypothetical protein [Anaerobutyricum hallii]
MIKTTAAYKEAIKKNRIFHHEVNINFADQTSMTVGDVDLFAFQLLDATSNTGSFDIGSAIAQQLLLKLNNVDGKFDNHDFSDAVITAKIGLELSDNSIEWLNKCIFTAEPGTVSGDTISVNAFDNMVKFDADYSQSKLVYPATLGAIVRDACSCCGVTLAPDTATFNKSNYVVQSRPNDSALTFRQVLQFVGQISCKFFKINTEGKLSAKWYDTDTLESIDMNNVNTEKVILIDELHTGSTLQTDDVVITGVKVIEENRDEENSSSEVTYKSGTDGYVLEVSGNKLIQGGKGAEVVNYLGECLNGLQFRPVSINASTDPCRESGDLAVIIDSKGNKYKTIFTNVNYVAHRAQALICGAEVPTRLSSTRYSQATQVYKEVRANIRKYRNEWSAAFKELQTAMDSKNGLFPVSETQEDGSTILYFCDKPALKDSSTVIKLSARGWGMSTDGGKTWNVGTLVDGTTITKILNTVGINADWINTGALTVKDDDGNIVLSVDASTGKLITKLAEIAGWNVNENAIYKDVTIDSDSYRVYFQPPNTNSGKNTWVFSIQKKINNSYQGLAVIRADGSILSYSEEFNARIEMRHGVLSFIKDGVERGKISISSDGSEFVIYLTDPNAEGAGQELSARSLKECHGGLVSRYWSNASIGTGTDNDKWTVVPAFSTTNDDNIKKSGFISRSNTQVIIQKKGVYQFVVRLAVKSSRANKRCNFAPFVNGERYSSYIDTAYSPVDAWYTSLKNYTLELEENDRVDFRAAPIESISVSLQIYDVNIFVLDYEGKYSI